MFTCAVCTQPGTTVQHGTSLCVAHLHDWLVSQEGKTAKRLYGIYSAEPPAKRDVQAAALMKLWLFKQEGWQVQEAREVIIPEPP